MSDQELSQLLLEKLNLLQSPVVKINSLDFAQENQLDHQKVVGAVKSLQSLGELIKANQVESKRFELSNEGGQIVENGSHEFRVWSTIPMDGSILQSDLMKSIPDSNVARLGFAKAMSNKWITLDKSSGKPMVKRNASNVKDEIRVLLKLVQSGAATKLNDAQRNDLKKRKLIQEIVEKSYDVHRGSNFQTTIEKPETDLNAEMIAKGTWRTKTFKEYNFNALGIAPDRGHLHPLLKVREQFRQIFLEMGFEEMATNNYVESSFWCFDTLFVPQKHPARDLQDTFYLSDPAECKDVPYDYMERVRAVHETGGDCGSIGYQYEWKESETRKNVLRTHTTAVSARMLYKAAQQYQNSGSKKFRPIKLFSIDRVFRNETLDATHLAEFNQIEGVVADRNLTLGHLMGMTKAFFEKLGIHDIRFKPTYNPYTEPSMEMYSWHSGLGKWVEIGNSGLFRPEMLKPMGLPEDINVLGWGLSLERPTMIKYGISNIRDLVGHKIDLQMVYGNPVCILEPRQQQQNQ
ncbi:phenylalanine-trna ligase alpha subunit b-like protein [Dermatophagoides farinae]|uniref:phenylalanine--tRNA ligase n=1 Tax=Dermatophagoides farinae TaxID=6954 RepID=A0A9D4SF65_DERFA|nr:phenylalanine--tRNA ligase alpha subunit A-like [Dermatophagoides farinae]KAH7638770.1 phenylalanine-trna ligase alpha subunit b-like protein [Dermatophagoides farinae]